MGRIVLTYVVPLVLPTVIYVIVRILAQRKAPQNWSDMPWMWLGIAGFVLVALTLGWLALFSGSEPGSSYSPPQVIDGSVRPGGFESPPERR
jgi:hypothetical protein